MIRYIAMIVPPIIYLLLMRWLAGDWKTTAKIVAVMVAGTLLCAVLIWSFLWGLGAI